MVNCCGAVVDARMHFFKTLSQGFKKLRSHFLGLCIFDGLYALLWFICTLLYTVYMLFIYIYCTLLTRLYSERVSAALIYNIYNNKLTI